MLIFLNIDGSARKVVPEHVYQGSGNVTGIDVVAPFPRDASLEVGFLLPTGEKKPYRPMRFTASDSSTGEVLGVWSYNLPNSITQYAGTVGVSFNVTYRSDAKQNRTTYKCEFQVEESLLPEGVVDPDPTVYDELRQYIQENAADINGLKTQIDDIHTAAENAATSATEAERSAQRVAEENATFQEGMAERMTGFEQDVDTKLFEQNTKIDLYKQGNDTNLQTHIAAVNTRMEAAEGVASGAKATAEGIDGKARSALDNSTQAVRTANEAKEIANNAAEGVGTVIKTGETFHANVQLASDLSATADVPVVPTTGAVKTAIEQSRLNTVFEQRFQGQQVSIPNTSKGVVNSYKLFGKSVQGSKNLFPYLTGPDVFDTNSFFVKVTGDTTKWMDIGGGEIRWKPEDGDNVIRINFHGLKPNTTYTLSCSADPFEGRIYRYMQLSRVYSDFVNGKIYSTFTTDAAGDYAATPTADQAFLYLLSAHENDSVVTKSPLRLYNFMLNEGSTALPYEPYTGGYPAPDNPIPIISVEGPVRVKSCGRNLFDFATLDSYVSSTTGQEATFNYAIWGRMHDNYKYMQGKFKSGQVYTLSYESKCSTYGDAPCFTFVYTDGTTEYPPICAEDYTKTVMTSNGNKTLDYVGMSYHSGVDASTWTVRKNTIMLNEGSTALPYKPYVEEVVEIPLIDRAGNSHQLRSLPGGISDEVDSERNVLIQRIGVYEYKENDPISVSTAGNTPNSVYVALYATTNKGETDTTNIYCNRFVGGRIYDVDQEGMAYEGSAEYKDIRFRINNTHTGVTSSDTEAVTREKIKAWLSANPLVVYYESAEPVEVSLVPLMEIPTQARHTYLSMLNTPAPELWADEFSWTEHGEPALLKNADGVGLLFISLAHLIMDRRTGKSVAQTLLENGYSLDMLTQNVVEVAEALTSHKNETAQNFAKLLDGTTKVHTAVHAEQASVADSANSSISASKVTGSIGDQPLGNIFEADGLTVKKATDSKTVNDINFKIEGNVLKVGDLIVPQKKLLWSGFENLVRPMNEFYIIFVSDESLCYKTLEIGVQTRGCIKYYKFHIIECGEYQTFFAGANDDAVVYPITFKISEDYLTLEGKCKSSGLGNAFVMNVYEILE